MDRALGELARNALRSARQITKLATKAQSEAVQLTAARATIADLMAIANHAELKAELQDIKQRLDVQEARRAKRKP